MAFRNFRKDVSGVFYIIAFLLDELLASVLNLRFVKYAFFYYDAGILGFYFCRDVGFVSKMRCVSWVNFKAMEVTYRMGLFAMVGKLWKDGGF